MIDDQPTKRITIKPCYNKYLQATPKQLNTLEKLINKNKLQVADNIKHYISKKDMCLLIHNAIYSKVKLNVVRYY